MSAPGDVDAPAAGREGGGGAELPAPKHAPVRSFVGQIPFLSGSPISRPNLSPNLYPSPILPARQRTGGKHRTGTLISTHGNDFGVGRATTSASPEQGARRRVVGVPPTPNRGRRMPYARLARRPGRPATCSARTPRRRL